MSGFPGTRAHALRALVQTWRAGIIGLTLGVLASPVQAEGETETKTLGGRWFASPLVVQWAIGTWGEACGPKPGGGGEGAGGVIISQNGSELKFTGAGRSFSTTNCWEQYPGLKRVSHSAGKRSWSNVCRTQPTDSRQATVRTSVTATDTSIYFDETGQYQFVVSGQNCTASSRRTRRYTLVQREGEMPLSNPGADNPEVINPDARKEPDEALLKERTAEFDGPNKRGAARCAAKGPANKLEVSPARKLMRPGDEFAFRATVTDARGCRLSSNVVRWELTQEQPHVSLKPGGLVEVSPEAGESQFDLKATVAGQALTVNVQVVPDDRYERLLAGGQFNPSGESEEASSVALTSSSVGTKTAIAEDAGATRKAWFVGLSVTLALLIGGLGIVSLRQGQGRRKPPPDPPRTEHRPKAAARKVRQRPEPVKGQPPPKVCPACGTLYSGNAQFCGRDGTSLIQVN